jgi:hypothetical protein
LIDIVDKIYKFNEDAGLIDAGYDDLRESSYQIEEALEGFKSKYGLLNDGTNDNKVYFGLSDLSDSILHGRSPKDVSRLITRDIDNDFTISDVDRLDKAIDAIVFATGSIAKLGLTREQAYRAIDVVLEANLQKLGCPKDSEGKLMKPEGFKNPEEELEKILKERDE